MMIYIRVIAAALIVAASAYTAQAQTPIRLGYTATTQWLAAYVAQREGIFKKHGLDVLMQEVPGGALVPGLQGGSLDIITLPPTNSLLAVEGGLDLVFVAGTAVTEKADKDVGIIVASGIASPQDLLGKKIGVPSIGGFLYVMGRKWITDKGIDAKSVSFVEVGFPQVPDLLKSGTIQGAVSTSPFLDRAVQSGNATVLGYLAADLPSRTAGSYYTTTRQWADAHPEAVGAFRSAIEEAALFAKEKPDVARGHMAKFVKLPPEVIASIALPHLDPGVTEAQVSFWIDTLHELGMIKSKPTASRLIAK
ncbi:ABC transporter substrate-binding protein [Bradyrhizobium manausense]